jgi:hypothetical protein
MVGASAVMGGETSPWGACGGRPGGSWFSRVFDGRDRKRRLDDAFDELQFDVRGKRVLDVASRKDAVDESSGPGSERFDVIVSSLPSGGGAEGLGALREQLTPGGVLCVFVPVASSPLWNVAGAVSSAGFDVLFAEGAFVTPGARLFDRAGLLPMRALVVARRAA